MIHVCTTVEVRHFLFFLLVVRTIPRVRVQHEVPESPNVRSSSISRPRSMTWKAFVRATPAKLLYALSPKKESYSRKITLDYTVYATGGSSPEGDQP